MDRSLLFHINHWPESLSPFFVFLSEAVDLTAVRIVLLAGILFFAFRRSTRKGTLLAGFGWVLADYTTKVLKESIAFPRPYNDPTLGFDVIVRMGTSDSMGTASAHAANMAFVATVLTFYFRWWGTPWIVLAILVGFSRVYVAAHFPSQVLYGWLIGVALALGVCCFAEWISKRVRARREANAPHPEEPSDQDAPENPEAAPQP